MNNSTENDGKNAPNQNVGDSYPILSKTHAINQNKEETFGNVIV